MLEIFLSSLEFDILSFKRLGSKVMTARNFLGKGIVRAQAIIFERLNRPSTHVAHLVVFLQTRGPEHKGKGSFESDKQRPDLRYIG
jgi:hypothetical protein